MRRKHVDYTGMCSNQLTAVERVGTSKNRAATWLFSCTCGGYTIVEARMVFAGRVISCGCAHKSGNYKHGACVGKPTRTHNIWRNMVSRCRPDGEKHYGGRGIKVCERWLLFENFLSDMGEAPLGFSIERVDVNGHYEPDNCTWIPRVEQSKNTRRCRRVMLYGRVQIATAWAKELGINYDTFIRWVRRGCDVEERIRLYQPRKRKLAQSVADEQC